VTYYDRKADVLLIELSGEAVDHSDEHAWGLVDVAADGHAVSLELWQASRCLPAEALSALPAPPAFTPESRRTA
jgi:uncharacterized protein YuzE